MGELEALQKWQQTVGLLFEHKKVELLKIHAKRNSIKKQQKLVHEINVLAQILNEDIINEENIGTTIIN